MGDDVQTVIDKESRSYIKEYYKYPEGGQHSPVNLQSLINLLDDPDFQQYAYKLVNSIMSSGYKIVKKNKPEERARDKEEEFEKKFNGRMYLDEMYTQLVVLRNSFTEIVYKSKRPYEIFTVEPVNMEIITNNYGKVLGHLQSADSNFYYTSGAMPRSVLDRTGDATGNANPEQNNSVFWTDEEMVHMYSKKIDSNPWGHVDTMSMLRTVQTKRVIEGYVEWLYTQNKFRDLWVVKKANSTQLKNFIQDIKDGVVDKLKDLVVEGDIEKIITREWKDGMTVIAYLAYLKDEIRDFFHIPPTIGGKGSSSNRSSGEFEVRWDWNTTLKTWQEIAAWQINYRLFPLLGWSQFRFVHNPNDRMNDTDMLADAVTMKGLGVKKEHIEQFLRTGVLPDKIELMEPEEAMPNMGEGNQQFQNKFAESRKPQDDQSKAQKSETGSESETRPDQIIGKSPEITKRKELEPSPAWVL